TTDFIDRHAPARRRTVTSAEVGRTALGCALWDQARRRSRAKVLATLPSGWRNNPGTLEHVKYRDAGAGGDHQIDVAYRLARGGTFRCAIDGEGAIAQTFAAGRGEIDLAVDGVRRQLRIVAAGDERWVHDGVVQVHLVEVPRFPRAGRPQVRGG